MQPFQFSPSETTGESPFFLMYGREPRLMIDCSLLKPVEVSTSILEHRQRIIRNTELGLQIARERTHKAQQRMKIYYDHKSAPPNFIVGDRVWVYTPKTRKGLTKKFAHNWYGPYRKIKQLGPVHYRLRTNGNKLVTTTVHANRMKHYIDPKDRLLHPPLGGDSHTRDLLPSELPEGTWESTPNPRSPDPGEGKSADTGEATIHRDGNTPNTRQRTEEPRGGKNPTPKPDSPAGDQPAIDNISIFNAEKLLDKCIHNG